MSQSTPRSLSLAGLQVAHAAVNGGMIANFGQGIARQLVAEGVSLHFFASSLSVFGWPPPIAELERLGGSFHGLALSERMRPHEALRSLLTMASRLRRLRIDVLHTRGTVMGIVGRLAGRLAGTRWVLHHQDDLYFRELSLGPARRLAVARLEGGLARITDRSFFVSRAVLDAALQVGFAPEKCVLVGHDLSEVFQCALAAGEVDRRIGLDHLRSLGVPEGGHIVGCVGRLSELKGIDLFVDVAASLAPRLPGWYFLVKGDGPLRASLQARASRLGLGGRLFFLVEELPAVALPSLYACFDIFALPTRREGFGMAFAEAMSVGVPVIGPQIAPVTEVVPPGCGMLVRPEDRRALESAIADLAGSAALRHAYASAGKAHAEATWSGWRSAAKVVRTYRGLLRRDGERLHYA